jgi:glycosyltransferase involved in cell wall biosynthesis
MMETTQPLVSVILPCFNQAHFLRNSIESIFDQTYPKIEVIVIDDGSTDNTLEVAKGFGGAKVFHQNNQGLANARNAGFARSEGEIVVFLDADDRLLPDAIETLTEWLVEHPDTALVSGLCRLIDETGEDLGKYQPVLPTEDRLSAQLRAGYIWMPGTVAYRRSVLDELGVFDPKVDASADYDLYLRIAWSHPIHEIDSLIGEYRQHQSSMSQNSGRMLRDGSRVLRRHRPPRSAHPHYRQAYREGRGIIRNYYGGLLVDQVDAAIRNRDLRRAFAGVLRLLRWHPAGFRAILRGAIESNRLVFRVTEEANYAGTDDLENALVPSKRLALESILPSWTPIGRPFNRQPDGQSAITLRCRKATADTVAVFGDRFLDTTVESPELVTAIVPAELYEGPGDYTVYLRRVR